MIFDTIRGTKNKNRKPLDALQQNVADNILKNNVRYDLANSLMQTANPGTGGAVDFFAPFVGRMAGGYLAGREENRAYEQGLQSPTQTDVDNVKYQTELVKALELQRLKGEQELELKSKLADQKLQFETANPEVQLEFFKMANPNNPMRTDIIERRYDKRTGQMIGERNIGTEAMTAAEITQSNFYAPKQVTAIDPITGQPVLTNIQVNRLGQQITQGVPDLGGQSQPGALLQKTLSQPQGQSIPSVSLQDLQQPIDNAVGKIIPPPLPPVGSVAPISSGYLSDVKSPLGATGRQALMAEDALKNVDETIKPFVIGGQQAAQTLASINGWQEKLISGELDTGLTQIALQPMAQIASSLGFDTQAPVAEWFTAFANEIALGNVSSMKGSLSDKDVRFLVSIGPNLNNTVEGNMAILETLRKNALINQRKAQLAGQFKRALVADPYLDIDSFFAKDEQLQSLYNTDVQSEVERKLKGGKTQPVGTTKQAAPDKKSVLSDVFGD